MQKVPADNRDEKQHNPVLFFILFVSAIVIIAVVFNFLTGMMFLDSGNIRIILSSSIYPAFIAWVFCFLFACGYADLSIGSVVVLGTLATCVFGNFYGYAGVLLGGVVVGLLLVFVNLTIFATTKISSWIASVSLAIIYEAIAVALRLNKSTRSLIDAELSRDFRALGQFPYNLVLLIVGLIIIYFVYNRTSIGLNIRAIGGNKDVSRALGINVFRTLLWVGLICGLITGFASVIQQSYSVRTLTMVGLTSLQMIFTPLAIALLAQIFQTRINIIVAVPFCSIVISAVFNAMTFFGVPSGTLQSVFLCILLIAFGVIGQRGVKEVVK